MAQNAGKLRCVLLRHTLPDGSAHLDWMIEVDQGPLITFRVALDVNPLTDRSFDADRIGQHRRDYLDYQGPVSGGRGAVLRVAASPLTVTVNDAEHLELLIDGRAIVGRPAAGAVWRFRTLDPE